jgi:hypothetical protein
MQPAPKKVDAVAWVSRGEIASYISEQSTPDIELMIA